MDYRLEDEDFQIQCNNVLDDIRKYFKEKNVSNQVAITAMFTFCMGHLSLKEENKEKFEEYILNVINGFYLCKKNTASHFGMD